VGRESSQSMGRDSVELVRRAYLAWQEGDLEGLISLLDPQVTWSPVLRFLEGRRTAVGHRAVRRWFRWIRITYRSVEPLPRHFEDHGHRVLVLGRLVGGSRLGEGDLDVPVAWVWTVRGDRIAVMQAFRDERAARQAIRAPD
jgi:ketosteroid isomerase-like protein